MKVQSDLFSLLNLNTSITLLAFTRQVWKCTNCYLHIHTHLFNHIHLQRCFFVVFFLLCLISNLRSSFIYFTCYKFRNFPINSAFTCTYIKINKWYFYVYFLTHTHKNNKTFSLYFWIMILKKKKFLKF